MKMTTQLERFWKDFWDNLFTNYITILKIAVGIAVVLAVFALFTSPAKHWLPFYDRFPSWLTDQALIYYLPAVLYFVGICFVLASFVYLMVLFKRWMLD